MAIVGTCENESPNQLPAWTPNRFAVFLEYDPAGLPTNLKDVWKVAISLSGVRIARASKDRDHGIKGRNCGSCKNSRQIDGNIEREPTPRTIPLFLATDANLEARFFFDSRAIGSIACREDAPERQRRSDTGRRPDLDGGDGAMPVFPTPP